MNLIEKIKAYFAGRGNKKNMQDLLSVFIIGLILIITVNFFMTQSKPSPGYIEVKKDNEEARQALNTTLSYEEKMKKELMDILSLIDGVGQVNVMIYFQTGTEAVPAYSQNTSVRVTEENDSSGGKRVTNENTNSNTIVTINEAGVSKPFIVQELKPKISGVIVIAEGAGNPDIKYKLYEAVKTVFNLEQYKINIYPMQKK
ncbi:hypothetical protein OXPF_13950 [Oxobacter pfennigii]|uniref:Stage III sporulation protein AG n=1 Tax=Oxobacter pfennigii TaxID=36849 RepID=A0A0P8WQU2_9CLOT|nr:stage III sporulation protein AG [Oxobacter pfennigii]KPU44917.1 hypothetical protein OXPF_13950 [Oxobacter pfennigii]